MANKTEYLAQVIMRKANDRTINESDVKFLIESHWLEATKLLDNINRTSLNDNDKAQRLMQFERDFGLPKDYLEVNIVKL